MCPAFRKQVEARKLFWYLLLQDNLQDVKTKQKTIPLPKKPPSNKNKVKNTKGCLQLRMVLTTRWHLLRWRVLLYFSGDLLSCHSGVLHAFPVKVSQRPPFPLTAPVMWSQLHPWFRRKPCFSGLTESVLCIPRGRGYYSGMSTQSSKTQEGATGLGRGCWFKGSHFSLLDCQPWEMRFWEWLSYLRGETDWEGSPASKENWEMLPSDINSMLDQTVPVASVSMNLSKHMHQGRGGDTLLFKTF